MVRSFMPLKRRSGAPLVYTLHDYGVVCAKRSFVYRGLPCTGPGPLKCLQCAGRNYGAARGSAITTGNWLMQPLERSTVDMFLPVSNAVARGNDLVEQALPHEVVPNFVPDDVAERVDQADPALAALPSLPFWLYVGALSRHKGLHTLLAAYRSMAASPPLVVIGAPWADTPAEFPANVTVLRNLPHAAVMAAWSRASLAVVPSIFPDPCPTVAMEAMACGLPVVATNVGGLPDLVDDGQTGLLVPPADVRALRAALAAMANKPDMARQMGEAGRQRVAAFTASAIVGRIEGIYERAVEARA
jgi:glycosyltransferase involved in cell wall biosynthesis